MVAPETNRERERERGDINQPFLISETESCDDLKLYLHTRKTADCFLADYYTITGTDPEPGLHVSEITA